VGVDGNPCGLDGVLTALPLGLYVSLMVLPFIVKEFCSLFGVTGESARAGPWYMLAGGVA